MEYLSVCVIQLFLKATTPSVLKSTAGSLSLVQTTPKFSFLALHAKHIWFKRKEWGIGVVYQTEKDQVVVLEVSIYPVPQL